MNHPGNRLALLAFALTAVVPAITTKAAMLAVYEGNSPSGGGYTWSYRVSLPDPVRVQTGDFFTIFDFVGFTGEHSEPAGWTLVTEALGSVPVLIDVPDDDPTVANLTWRYTGLTPIIGEAQDIGDFTAESAFNLLADDWFASQSTRDTGTLAGTPISNLTVIPVPVPEPTAVGLLALGAGALLSRRR